MRTIGRHRDTASPRGDVRRLCSYCGVAYLRSELVRDASGNLACVDELPGLDMVSLSEGNAEAATHRSMGEYVGPTDGSVDSKNTAGAPPFNWNGHPSANPVTVDITFWASGGYWDLASVGGNQGDPFT